MKTLTTTYSPHLIGRLKNEQIYSESPADNNTLAFRERMQQALEKNSAISKEDQEYLVTLITMMQNGKL